MPTTIKVYADFICPWCYIGMERLNRLEKERAVQLHWKPYLLRPDIPPGGVPPDAILPPAYLEQAEAAVREATQAAGLPLNRPALVPNTRQAHEVALLAEQKGLGDAYHRAVFTAYFAHARDIGNAKVLADIGNEIGMDRNEILEILNTGRYRDEVERAVGDAVKQGIRGVPSFIFASGRGFSGAQPYEIFLRAVDAAA